MAGKSAALEESCWVICKPNPLKTVGGLAPAVLAETLCLSRPSVPTQTSMAHETLLTICFTPIAPSYPSLFTSYGRLPCALRCATKFRRLHPSLGRGRILF